MVAVFEYVSRCFISSDFIKYYHRTLEADMAPESKDKLLQELLKCGCEEKKVFGVLNAKLLV